MVAKTCEICSVAGISKHLLETESTCSLFVSLVHIHVSNIALNKNNNQCVPNDAHNHAEIINTYFDDM